MAVKTSLNEVVEGSVLVFSKETEVGDLDFMARHLTVTAIETESERQVDGILHVDGLVLEETL